MTVIATDADILFNSVKSKDPENILKRLDNLGYTICIPLTVLGEVLLTGISKQRKEDILEIIDYCYNLDNLVWMTPNKKLRECCPCVDEADQREYGLTDRTNLGYATSYNAGDLKVDYFLTTDTKLPHVKLKCKEKCNSIPPQIIDPATLKRILSKR